MGALLIAALVALLLPATGRAACGGAESAQTTKHPRGQLPPLAIGDSTMLLSLPGLASRGFDANAHGCRQFIQALQLLSQLKAQGRLPHLVVLALGANGEIAESDIAHALRLLGAGRLLVLLTPRQLGGAPGANAVLERGEARAHPGNILLLDWVKYSAMHPSWFQPDGLHLTPPGVHALTDLISQALPYAYVPCPPQGRKRSTARRSHPSALLGPQAMAAAVTPLTINATLVHTGYVGVTLTGPSGASVQLSEQTSTGSTPIQTVVLGANGAQVPDLLAWSCDQLQVKLTAATLPPSEPEQASVDVTTPSCATRLTSTIKRTARSGHAAAITLTDSWGIGNLPLSICTSPPGGQQACRQWQLRAGQRRRVVRIGVPRPGGWRITAQTRFGYRHSATVWVKPGGGRLRLLAAGDSEMQILDGFIGQDLASRHVQVTSDARISTGLTKPFFFNWEAHARRQASTLRPDVTVIFIGANDGFTVPGPGGQAISCCSSAWSGGYANLVAEMMRSYLRGNAGRVYWFLLPAPRPANFQSLFDAINSGIRAAASRFPGRVALIDANAFFTPNNQYRDYMTYQGHGFVIHEPDGVHLSSASDEIAARLLVKQLIADRVIR